MIGLVEDVIKSGAPKEGFGERVFEMLSRYQRPATPWSELEEIASALQEMGTTGADGFVKALESPYYQTRRFAVRMLSDSGLGQEVIEELLKKALNDITWRVICSWQNPPIYSKLASTYPGPHCMTYPPKIDVDSTSTWSRRLPWL